MNIPEKSNWYAEALASTAEFYADHPDSDDLVDSGQYLLTMLAAKMDEALNEERQSLYGFESRLLERYRAPINLFKFHNLLHREGGDFFINQYQRNHSIEDDYVFQALTKLHPRAISIAEEILRLIEAGYADGALARWRSIHEIACTAQFIQQNRQDTAQRFLDYRVVDDYHEMKALQKHHKKLNMKPLNEEKMKNLEKLHKEALEKYGNDFNRPHGWAHPDLDGYVSFKSIEEEAGLSHFRPIYKWASDQIHSDTKGATHSLSTMLTDEAAVTSGPSNIGFTDPAQYTAMALVEVTDALLQLDFRPEHRLAILTITAIQNEIPEAFHQVEKQIERDEQNFNAEKLVEDILDL